MVLGEAPLQGGEGVWPDMPFEPNAAPFFSADLDVAMNGVWVCRGSEPFEPPEKVSFDGRDVSVTVDLKSGPARATVWTNDLTHAYVHENSAYSS